jgi:hypothetical protein
MSKIAHFKAAKKTFVRYRTIKRAVEDGLDEAAQVAEEYLAKPTTYWKEKASFDQSKTAWTRTITATDKRYGWIDKGTRARLIRPRRAKVLRFAADSRPKTRPGTMTGSAGAAGYPIVFSRAVRHPGIKARKFSQQAKKHMDKRLPKIMNKAIKAHLK